MPLKIVRNDITKMNTEAVYKAAGFEEFLKYREEKNGYVSDEETKLRSCYRKSLALAKENGIHTISFPLIATGGYGFPKEEGMRIAVDEINTFLLTNEMQINLVVFDDKATVLGEKLYPDLEAYIDHHYVEVARQVEYGEADFARMVPMASATPKCSAPSFGSIFKRDKKETSECRLTSVCREEAACFDFEEQHESKLEERMHHLSDTFSEYLMYLIQLKHMENAEVWKRAIVDKKIFSKIKTNPNYHPQKLTALCLCIGAKLNLDETKDLLARAGYALSPCDKTDIIFSYFIENEIYDMIELDIQLEEHGLPCIIS